MSPWHRPHTWIGFIGSCELCFKVINWAHTEYMSENKIPLCDRHHFRMRPEESSFLPAVIFKCASPNCGRYYGKPHGYFSVLPGVPALERIDPADRQMKACPVKRHSRAFMAITRPKNTGQGAKGNWCWYCYECNPTK
jgi:hypothetical protein